MQASRKTSVAGSFKKNFLQFAQQKGSVLQICALKMMAVHSNQSMWWCKNAQV
jgi:hypothetical protein